MAVALPVNREEDQQFMTVCYPVPIHLAQQQQPWIDLYNHHTLSSVKLQANYIDPSSPKDDLDFVIKSSYDHQKDLFKNKQEVLYHADIYDENNGQVLTNRIKSCPEKKMPLNHPLIITRQEKQEDTYTAKILPGRNHIHATNHGYSCKAGTGGYFLS